MRKFGTIIECVTAVGILSCATACSNKDLPPLGGSWYTENYITEYVIPDKFRSYSGLMTEGLIFYIDGKFSIFQGCAEFDAIAERNNDLSFNNRQSVAVWALYDGITSLSIVTVDYFDEAHPAGSDVSDIVTCKFQTYYEYIQNGYVAVEQDLEPPYFSGWPTATVYEMGLSDVNYDNSQIMDTKIIIWFTSEPEEPGVYEFRFRVDLPNTWFRETFYYEFK